MGLERMEDFQPITPGRTAVSTRGGRRCTNKILAEERAAELQLVEEEEEEEDCCRTPKSEDQILRTQIKVCPPAPKKPRPVARKWRPPAHGRFLRVSDDLASMFFILSCPPSSTKRKIVDLPVPTPKL